MDRQPYIYTLPEQFISDTSVPLHWKLYTLINGFWIAGKPVFASNSFFAAKLSCSERYVQMCLEKLEEMQLLRRIGVSQNRTIIPWGTNHEFVGGRTDSSKGDEPAVHHISDSISDTIKGVAIAPQVIEVTEVQENTRSARKPKYPHSKEVFSWFPNPERSWELNITELKHAELLFDRGEFQVKAGLRFVAENRDDQFCPTVVKPSDLERKWKDLFSYKNKNGL